MLGESPNVYHYTFAQRRGLMPLCKVHLLAASDWLGSVDLHYWGGRLRPFFCAPVPTYSDVHCAPVLEKQPYPARRSVNVNRP